MNYPKDLGPVFDAGMLPRQKPNKDTGRPAYIWGPRDGSSIGMMLSGGLIPGLAELGAGYGTLCRNKMWEAHPIEKFVDECAEDWETYCDTFGTDDKPRPPYPYTHDYVREIVEKNDREGEEEMLRQQARA